MELPNTTSECQDKINELGLQIGLLKLRIMQLRIEASKKWWFEKHKITGDVVFLSSVKNVGGKGEHDSYQFSFRVEGKKLDVYIVDGDCKCFIDNTPLQDIPSDSVIGVLVNAIKNSPYAAHEKNNFT